MHLIVDRGLHGFRGPHRGVYNTYRVKVIIIIIIFVYLWSTDHKQHIDNKMQYAMRKVKVSTS